MIQGKAKGAIKIRRALTPGGDVSRGSKAHHTTPRCNMNREEAARLLKVSKPVKKGPALNRLFKLN
jgi:hypothetical protein